MFSLSTADGSLNCSSHLLSKYFVEAPSFCLLWCLDCFCFDLTNIYLMVVIFNNHVVHTILNSMHFVVKIVAWLRSFLLYLKPIKLILLAKSLSGVDMHHRNLCRGVWNNQYLKWKISYFPKYTTGSKVYVQQFFQLSLSLISVSIFLVQVLSK